VTNDERRARQSEALAAAREAARDGRPEESDESEQTDRDARQQGDGREPNQRDVRERTERERSQTDAGHRGGHRRREETGRDGERQREETRDGERQRGDRRPRGDETGGESVDRTPDRVERVSAADHDAALITAFEHDGYDCELGRVGDDFVGFVRVPPDHDRLHLMWELDVPGEFGYGPDADGWVGFDTRPVDRELRPREAAMALAGVAAQVAERSRSRPT